MLALIGALGNVLPAHAEAPADGGVPDLPGRAAAVTPGVSKLKPDAAKLLAGARSAAPGKAGGALRLGTPTAGAPVRMAGAAQQAQAAVCTPYLSKQVTRSGLGSASHGRNSRYRYYICWTRNRYGAKRGCDIHRFNADELEAAVGQALIDFYTTGHDVIDQTVSEFLTAHGQATSNDHQQLEAVKRQLRDASAAVDRYLTAFERGTLDDEDPDIQARLVNLRKQNKQFRADKARLEFDLDKPPPGHRPRTWH
jgi:hypothetical protein